MKMTNNTNNRSKEIYFEDLIILESKIEKARKLQLNC